MKIDRTSGPGEVLDDEGSAYHEAAHAVAMWRHGFGIAELSIEGTDELRAYTEPARIVVIRPEDSPATKRHRVELQAMYLLAGDVAARLLRPDVGSRQSQSDHAQLHELMFAVEDDGAVQLAWCAYLWQRVYTFISWPGQWYLIVGLAHQLLEHRTLSGAAAERYLTVAADQLQYDPWMPNCVLVGEVRFACSPFHRDWYEKSWDTPLTPKRTEMPETLTGLSANLDTRLIGDVLPALSTRAYRRLFFAGIRTVADLEDWTPFALRSLRGLGTGTLKEILGAISAAGIRIGPDTREYPWQRNPARWKESGRMDEHWR